MKQMPEINILPVYTLTLPVMKKEIHYNPFNVQQEKALLISLEDNNPDDIIRNYENILRTCIMTEIDWDKLTIVDFIVLVINIRSKSKGDTLELQKKECINKECKQSFEFSVSIEDSIKYDNKDKLKTVVNINEDLSFELSPLSYKFLFGLDKIEDEVDLYIHTTLHSITKVFWKKDIYTPDKESLRDNVIINLRRRDIKKIFVEYKKLITSYLEINYVCPICGEKETVKIDNYLKSLK